MYKSSEEEEYKQTSAEGEVGQASPTATEVCMPQSHSHECYKKSAAPRLPGYYTGNCIAIYIYLNQMFGEHFSQFCLLHLTNFITPFCFFF